MIIIEIIAFVLGAAFVNAQITYWLWWCLGSPQAHPIDSWDETGLYATAKNGRIFSFLGRWICEQYTKTETAKFAAYSQRGGTPAEYQPTHLNFWKSAGVCIFCFAVWAGWFLALPWYWAATHYLAYNGQWFETLALLLMHGALLLFVLKREMEV